MTRIATEVFGPLSRADQRRWAEVYVRGLLAEPGRKSARRIAERIPWGGADQALQQFISQSPWDPVPVRRALVSSMQGVIRPAAWVLHEVTFVKNGRLSPGVDRQYVRSLGRVCNCQLGLAVVLTDGSRCIPMEWRLMMPASWDRDDRRRRARVPPGETHQPRWRHAVQALDATSEWTEVHHAPVVCEAVVPADALALSATLDELQYDYVIEVSGSLRVLRPGPRWTVPRGLPGGPAADLGVPLADLVRALGDQDRHTVVWPTADGRVSRSQFVTVEARPVTHRGLAPRGAPGRCLVLAEWPHSQPEPRAFWLTNLVDHAPTELIRLARMRDVVRAAVAEMQDRFGLCAYEGRSFLGWHHHVTLSAVAYGVSLAHAERCGR